jgi:hypothetical protein
MINQSGLYSYTQLMNLWIQAGGSKLNAAMAAAVAMAESAGNPNATNNNGNGSIDRGLWQINSVHGSQSTYDPVANARAAIQISNNGTTWRPWCTAYSDGLCGSKGGTYLGTGSPFLKFLSGGSIGSTTNTGTNTSPNSGSTSAISWQQTSQNAGWFDWVVPLLGQEGQTLSGQGGSFLGIPLGGFAKTIEGGIAGAIGDVLKPVGRALLHGLFVIGGASMMLLGASLLMQSAGVPIGSVGLQKGQSEPEPAIQDVPPPDDSQYQADRKKAVSQLGRQSQREAQQAPGKGTHRKASTSSRSGRTEKLAGKAAEGEKAAETAAVAA